MEEPNRPILITGGTGTLGRAFARVCVERGLPHRLLCRAEMEISSRTSVCAQLDGHKAPPAAVINTAGYVRVDEAEGDAERCFRENRDGPILLGRECARRGIPLVLFSSDLVFDGTSCRPYVESDRVNPLNVYGRSKAEMEQRVLEAWPEALVVRTSAFFGPWDEYNFVVCALRAWSRGEPVRVLDGVVSPTYVPDLVTSCLDLLAERVAGVRHMANCGAVSWRELAKAVATRAGLPARIEVMRDRLPAERPAYSVLGTEHGPALPPWSDALDRCLAERSSLALHPVGG